MRPGHAGRRGGTSPRIAILLLGLAVPALAQPVPNGPEFPVNTYTTSYQGLPSVAMDAAGNFVIVWPSHTQDGNGYAVYGRRFDPTGAGGPEFRVNVRTQSDQRAPSVAMDPAGNFVVVWQSFGQDGSNYGIFGRRFDSAGTAGPEFQVSVYTTNRQSYPSVAIDPAGNFVVAWQSYSQDGSGIGVFGRQFTAAGTPGPEFRVNDHTAADQRSASVAMDSGGNFVVVWQSDDQDGSYSGIFGRHFASSGTPGPEFQVNAYTNYYQGLPSVAMDRDGNFVVAWQSSRSVFPGDVSGRQFSAAGTPGPEFRVNAHTTDDQRFAGVAMDAGGDFVVVWNSYLQDGSGLGVFGRQFTAVGIPGPEFQVNSYTTNNQFFPSVAMGPAGTFVVAWQSLHQDGSQTGVFAQRFTAPDLIFEDGFEA